MVPKCEIESRTPGSWYQMVLATLAPPPSFCSKLAAPVLIALHSFSPDSAFPSTGGSGTIRTTPAWFLDAGGLLERQNRVGKELLELHLFLLVPWYQTIYRVAVNSSTLSLVSLNVMKYMFFFHA